MKKAGRKKAARAKPSKKHATEQTTDELAERLFPKAVRDKIKREVGGNSKEK